jgi:HD-like signal output (HDOD) protein
MNSEDPSIRRVGEIVQADAATSIRILRVVNSALFGLRTEVGDLVQATALLGMRAIGSLAMAASTFADSSLNQRFLDRMWTESIIVGTLARIFALDLGLGRNDLEESQLGGLLHDIGQFVLFKNWPDDFAAVDPVDRDRSELGLLAQHTPTSVGISPRCGSCRRASSTP